MDTPETRQLQLPEGFLSFLETTALPMPPIPVECLDLLEAVTDVWFATSPQSIACAPLFLHDLQTALDDNADYVGYGLIGHPFGTPYALLLICRRGLRLGVCLPWGGAYNDPQAERDNLTAALGIVELCLQAGPEAGSLEVLITGQGCEWRYCTETRELEGEDLDGLLTALEKEAETGEAVSPAQWLAV